LWHFHVYMYYNLNWFISSIFLHSTLVPTGLTGLVPTGFNWFKKFYIHFCREYINYIHFLNFLLLPYPSHIWTPLSVTCFS
jgi:hypothetical protein